MEVIITPSAQKQLTSLPLSERKKVQRKLMALEKEPYLGKKLEGQLSDHRSLRSWPYRILYLISGKNPKIFVTHISRRQGAYK